jgi:predicted PurR-regulated permease PerM
MTNPILPNRELEKRISDGALDVLIRAGLVLSLAMLCYQVMHPFITVLVWATILAVTLYPAHQKLAGKLGGKQGLAATLIVLLGMLLIVVPTTALVNSLGDSVHGLVNGIGDNTLRIPAPPPAVGEWPIVGKKLYAVWSRAHANLPALVQSMQPKLGELAKTALGFVASIGGGMLKFLLSFGIAGIIMAFGEAGASSSRRIFCRISGSARGASFTALATQTIRAVALGVLGIAFMQAMLVGLALLAAGVPWAGVLAVVVLVLGVAQIPALLVTVPAIVYIWSAGGHATALAAGYTVMLLVAGSIDNVLKPLLLGRGVDAPMPVVLLGALGGMATAGILGMFVGATLLALGYQIFMGWVDADPELVADGTDAQPGN